MGLASWFRNIFSKKEKDDNNVIEPTIKEKPLPHFSIDQVEIIHINPNVYLAHRAARICVGKLPNKNIKERITHLNNVIGVNHHESVAEHTNIIVLFKIPKNKNFEFDSFEYAEFISNMKYCNISTRSDKDTIYLLVGGSARAFMHLIRETSQSNHFLQYAKQAIYSSFEKCFLKSLIDDGLLEEDKCNYLPFSNISLVPSSITQVKDQYEDREVENFDYDCDEDTQDVEEIESDHVDIVYMSPINEIYNKVKEYGFTLADVYKLATISFVFHDISRSCSHQLVRHRNAISQESQRYVLQSGGFINPILLNKEDKYSDRRFKEVIEKTHSIVNRGFNEYQWLIDHRVTKEDARAFLPTNVITKLMMTMTYEHYAYFLQLRLAKSAQKEIRNLAEETTNFVLDPDKIESFITYCTTPYSLKKHLHMTDSYFVDDVIEEVLEPKSMEITTQDAAQDLLNKQDQYKELEKEN